MDLGVAELRSCDFCFEFGYHKNPVKILYVFVIFLMIVDFYQIHFAVLMRGSETNWLQVVDIWWREL